ncbi:MAG: hypothetical protein D6705_02585 [Deltaproteobacteria bacterium]|nr:MAG: hypothetical protein D6705_02585 [Deltaproteobacteria bacterium]
MRSRCVLAAVAYLAHAAFLAQWGHALDAAEERSDLLWLLVVVLLWSLAVGFIVAGFLLERDRRRARAEFDEAEDDEDEDADERILH